MKPKKYILILLSLIGLFVIFHFIIWNSFTKEIYSYDDKKIGDLGRMSYLNAFYSPKKREINLEKTHINFNGIEKIDILTLGDSFSNGGGGGLNPYYQDYIATNNNFKVMNIQAIRDNYIETVLILLNSGILDELKPRAIILQTIERHAIERYSCDFKWDISLSHDDVVKLLTDNKYQNKPPSPQFINNLNYNALLYNILYNFDDNAYFSQAYVSSLNEKMFTANGENLLFYFQDLENITDTNQKAINKLNQNLNKLQELLLAKNIKLYFMPAPDKYSLYSGYIQNNQYDESQFFELLRKEEKTYNFIDTKSILLELLENGEKDIYYPDDTHWSWKASKEIFKKERFHF